MDGDTSTNDTVAVLANGASGVKPSAKAFEEALTEVLESLAQQIVRDGEGARKLVTIDVAGAANGCAAEKIARSIANSPLVKTAIAGSDPNWGRIFRRPDTREWRSIRARRISTCRAFRCAAAVSRRISTKTS